VYVVLTLRAATPEDEGFLFRVYASTRTEELAAVDWDDAQKETFLLWQAATQHRYYGEYYPGATFQVILADETPVGRLYLHRRADEIRIMDIALLPEFRGRGYGTALIEQVLAEGRASGRRVTIHVELFNPALSLYRRLGFRQVAEHGVYWLMEWSPDGSGQADER
jgi:ribosomal protein S18 acetylase RimI-like enzyme